MGSVLNILPQRNIRDARGGIVLCKALAAFLAWGPTHTVLAADVDVYIVYAGKEKKIKNSLVETLPERLQVKSYNTDLLGLGDYSAVQKVASRLSRAKVVVIVGDGAMTALNNASIRTSLIVVNLSNNVIRSSDEVLYVLGSEIDSYRLSPNLRTTLVSTEDDIRSAETDVVVLKEGSLALEKAVAVLLKSRFQL